MATSTLRRLFTYARENKVDALENFTTEALAAAIRQDPRPFVRLMVRELQLPAREEPIDVVPATQVGIPGVGIIDLVVDVRYADRVVELWTEVKVLAGESGSQLTNYQRHIASLDPSVKPVLTTLSRAPFGTSLGIHWTPWQSVWRAAGLPDASVYWQDLRSFLEEIDMADTHDTPVSALEAASLGSAWALLRKTSRILALFAPVANERWPAFKWVSEDRQIQATLGGQFARHQRYLIVTGQQYRAYLFAGVAFDEGEALATLRVETLNKAIEPRRRLIDAADAAGLGPEWQRDISAWGGLLKTARLVSLPTHEAVAAWLLGAMQELQDAAILDLIPTLGKPEVGDGADLEDT